MLGKTIKSDPTWIYKTGRQLRIDQNGALFAPPPMMRDGGFVAAGKIVKENDHGKDEVTEADVPSSRPVTFEEPPHVAKNYGNNR